MNITGKTTLVGIFGYPVEQSRSPGMHNAAFAHLGLDFCYVPFLVKPEYLGEAAGALRALNLRGVNVTVPHKEKVIPFLDEVTEEASTIGAVNTILNSGGKLIGYNTDGRGFMKSLAEGGIGVKDKRVLIVGAGGAARAVGYYLVREAASVYLYNRNLDRAETLRLALSGDKAVLRVVSAEEARSGDFFSGVDIIINTTPLGLKPDDPLPLDRSVLTSSHAVCDLIYRETPFLKQAAHVGCRTIDGKGMLLWQGVFAFEIWTGVAPPVEVMRRALSGYP